jgi:hypothetical protein
MSSCTCSPNDIRIALIALVHVPNINRTHANEDAFTNRLAGLAASEQNVERENVHSGPIAAVLSFILHFFSSLLSYVSQLSWYGVYFHVDPLIYFTLPSITLQVTFQVGLIYGTRQFSFAYREHT